ncbi:hypothetical protein [Sphingomonas sp. NFR15]|uniref:hypothetical protein n=1 Tax=Sphingomonas sp. NFR15 TaxID=1566282 RepID=UPI00088E5762|nr:hypothetical protein [Sphingomonas sp. NFR15]SDA36034.1 hypothetical protein SAMN03159340_03495 [Sphingomonas sp. NFR15]
MTTNTPFGPGSPLNDLYKRQREMADLLKLARGPGYELQQRMKALEGPLAAYRDLEKTGVLAQIASLQRSGVLSNALASSTLHSASIAALQARSSPTWMLAIQSTARGIAQKDLGLLNTQQLLAASAGADVLKLVKTFDANRSIIEKVTAASKWSEQFRLLSDRFAPSLAGLKLAAERARLLDMQILRASAEVAAKSTVAIVAEQVLEAHGLIEAMGQADSHTQSLTLFAQFLSLVETIFSGFQGNTVKELKGVGAFRLIELLLMAFAIWHMVVPAEMSPVEKAAFEEVTNKIETVEEKLGKIVATDEAADTSYVDGLPRAQLKRDAAIRREPQGKAPVLMHGVKGTQLAIKDARGKWRLVVYRDLLTNQLSEGWVYAPAVQMLDEPA